MKNLKFLLFYIFILSALFFTCLVPYPVFSSATNLREVHISQINSYWESETSNKCFNKTCILSLGWRDGINSLIETGQSYQILDVKTKETFNLKRVGGINHADMIASTQEDFFTIKKLYKSNDLYNPVLLKLNEQTYVPASFNANVHGYQDHFCLHFKNSKTDGTGKIDKSHQKAVKTAQKAQLTE